MPRYFEYKRTGIAPCKSLAQHCPVRIHQETIKACLRHGCPPNLLWVTHSLEVVPKTYLRVAEVWHCDEQEQVLLHAGGYYSTHEGFEAVSRLLSFPMGMGLIGRCAKHGLPLLLDELSPDSGFLRSVAAHREGLTLGFALPIRSASGRKGVLSLFFSHSRERPSGGVEVWSASRAASPLELATAHHGIAEDFRRVSSLFSFKAGEGLPGRVAASATPEILDLSVQANEFLRAIAAETSGFVQAVGLPALGESLSAVVLLGHRTMPLCIYAEIWRRSPDAEFERIAELNANKQPCDEFNRIPWIEQAVELREPVPFTVHDVASPLGGIVMPFFPEDQSDWACVLIW